MPRDKSRLLADLLVRIKDAALTDAERASTRRRIEALYAEGVKPARDDEPQPAAPMPDAPEEAVAPPPAPHGWAAALSGLSVAMTDGGIIASVSFMGVPVRINLGSGKRRVRVDL